MGSKNAKKNVVLVEKNIFAAYVILIFIYFIFSLYYCGNHFNENFNVENFIAYALSLVFVAIGIRDFYSHGIGLYNVFLCCFFFILAMNCINLSGIQTPKSLTELYYFFFGPLLFSVLLKIADNVHVRKGKSLKLADADLLSVVLLVLLWALQIYLFWTKGIRLFTSTLTSSQSNLFTISGISGLLVIIEWVVLMLLPGIERKMLKGGIILTSLSVTILNANRTMFMRVAIYLILYYVYSYGDRIFKRKNMARLILAFGSILIIFALWGNYREKVAYSVSKDYIGSLLRSSSDNSVLNWIYAYTAINFDVLKQKVIGNTPLYSMDSLFIPLIRLFRGSDAAADVAARLGARVGNGLHGLNAATFLSTSITEWGRLYFMEMIILGSMVFLFVLLCKANSFYGGYLYLVMLAALSIFGNYYTDITSFFSICAGIAISFFVRFH